METSSNAKKTSFKGGVGKVSPSRIRLPVSARVGACSDGGAAFILRTLCLLIVRVWNKLKTQGFCWGSRCQPVPAT